VPKAPWPTSTPLPLPPALHVQVRVWDIRRFGSLRVLDHYATTPQRTLRQQQRQQQRAEVAHLRPDFESDASAPRHGPTLPTPVTPGKRLALAQLPLTPALAPLAPSSGCVGASRLPPKPCTVAGAHASAAGLPAPGTLSGETLAAAPGAGLF